MTAIADFEQLTSEQLVERARAGCEESFEELHRRFARPLLGFLSRKVASRADAEDLLQDVFVRVHRRLDQFKPGNSFSAWLYTIAYRTACSHHRGRRDTTELPADLAHERTPVAVLGEAEAHENIWRAAAGELSEAALEVFWLRYGEGLPIKEIAARTGRTQVHVKVMLHRGRTRLAARLVRMEEQP